MINTQDIRTIAQCAIILFLAKRFDLDVEALSQMWFKREFINLEPSQRQQFRQRLDRENSLQKDLK